MPRPKVYQSQTGNLPTIEFTLNKTMLGLDKNSAHTFKLPNSCVPEFMGAFNLTSDDLQNSIVVQIAGVAQAAQVRWGRSNRSKPRIYSANALPPRDHIFVQWSGKRFHSTQVAVHAEFSQEIAEFLSTGKMPSARLRFEHLSKNEFSLTRV